MEQIERTYGDIHVVIDPAEYLAFVERLSTGQGVVFHIEADFYTENPNDEFSGFSKWMNDDSWSLQYVNENGQITNHVELSLDEYEKVNRFLMKFRAGTL